MATRSQPQYSVTLRRAIAYELQQTAATAARVSLFLIDVPYIRVHEYISEHTLRARRLLCRCGVCDSGYQFF